MDVTISLPDEFAARVQRCGVSPEEYVKLLLNDAMRIAIDRERKSRPADTQRFLDRRAAEAEALRRAEALEDEAEQLEAVRLEQSRLEQMSLERLRQQQAGAEAAAVEAIKQQAATVLPTSASDGGH